jgi:hypothetical protein
MNSIRCTRHDRLREVENRRGKLASVAGGTWWHRAALLPPRPGPTAAGSPPRSLLRVRWKRSPNSASQNVRHRPQRARVLGLGSELHCAENAMEMGLREGANPARFTGRLEKTSGTLQVLSGGLLVLFPPGRVR